MMLIHKVNISPEAVFDYEECIALGKLDKYTLKNELEEYIRINAKLREKHYFHCKYYDDALGQMLRVFVYKKNKLGLMQLWELSGICQAEHWDEIIEDDGKIRTWLKTKVEQLEETDWVISYRVSQILKETKKTVIENVAKEVSDAFECKRDKETAEAVALLQGIYFDSRKRQRVRKKGGRHRWLFSPYW